MCVPALMGAIGAGGAATAAGAVAGASMLQNIGMVLSVGGTLMQGVMGMQAANANAAHVAQQQQVEAVLSSTEEQRTRQQFRSAIRRQAAELAGRGIALDSPTAVLLGQTAAREMSFAGQEVRSRGSARQQELTAERRALRARGTQSMLAGAFGAADRFLTAAPDVWPGLLR